MSRSVPPWASISTCGTTTRPIHAGTRANENYARELMQLFTIGLLMLNQDGTLQLDAKRQSDPDLRQTDDPEFAKVYTGWTYPTKPGAKLQKHNPAYFIGPMVPLSPITIRSSKTLLNGLVVAGRTNRRAGSEGRAGQHFQPSERRAVHQQASDSASGDQQSFARLCRRDGGGV